MCIFNIYYDLESNKELQFAKIGANSCCLGVGGWIDHRWSHTNVCMVAMIPFVRFCTCILIYESYHQSNALSRFQGPPSPLIKGMVRKKVYAWISIASKISLIDFYGCGIKSHKVNSEKNC